MEALFWIVIALVAYVYVGYPLFLLLIRLTGVKEVATDSAEPLVTLVISAFNEERVISTKLRNSVELNYPRDRLEIIVVSDASTDRTDERVAAFAGSAVSLIRMPDRAGKTIGLNEAVRRATGEVIVFSDANAIYDREALRMLVRNFGDPSVGAVVGRSCYTDPSNEADRRESSYWDYEVLLKSLESQTGSVVGGDGAIYAVRRSCYAPMAGDALSDFVNPLQVVQQGYRCVYEPGAFSTEDSAGRFDREFKRKVRIVNRAWRATMNMKTMLNPFKYGLFSLKLISHKLLRWLVPVLLLALFGTNLLLLDDGTIYFVVFWLQLSFYLAAFLGFSLVRSYRIPFFLSVPLYFCVVNVASLKGIVEAYLGKSYTTWSTPRTDRP